MKTNFLPKLILLFVLSVLIYSCTAEDSVAAPKKDTVVLKAGDTITGSGTSNPRG